MSFKSEFHMKGADLAMNHSTKKSASNKKRSIVSLLLIAAIIITGAFAFLSATDNKTNVFTVGNVKIGLWEKFDTDLSGSLEDDETFDSTKTEVSIEEGKTIIPGQTILKQPMVENTGKNPAYIFMAVGVPTATDANIKANQLGDKLQIKVKAFAVQEKYKQADNATAAWEAYRDTVKENLGTQDTSEGTELFALNNAQNSDWTVAKETAASTNDFTYKTDGYVYHFYILSAALPVGNTLSSSPIESVTFNSDVGTADENTATTNNVVPDGCTITTASGEVYNERDVLPDNFEATEETRLETEDYIYEVYEIPRGSGNIGWSVEVKDTTKTEYKPLLQYVNKGTLMYGKPLLFLDECFADCTNLISAPEIPDTVISMSKAFSGCSSLQSVGKLPSALTSMDNAFHKCASLTVAPEIPSSVEDVSQAFAECSSLSGTITVNGNPDEYHGFLRGTQITEVRGLTTLKTELLATKG